MNNYDSNGVSAVECGIGAIVGPAASEAERRQVERLAENYVREFGYRVRCLFDGGDIAYLWTGARGEWIGACCFGLRVYDGELPPGIAARHYAMQWIWFEAEERRKVHLTKALPYFVERFGKLIVEGPLSTGMDKFLQKHRAWPYESPGQLEEVCHWARRLWAAKRSR